jgi:putative transposase
LARARRGSNRRVGVKRAIARLRARETDRRKDWAEKTSTAITRRFDLIRVEDLQINNMTRSASGTATNPGRCVRRKAGLNRGILASGWVCWSAAWSRKPRPSAEDQSRVHESVLFGVRAGGPEVA